MGGVPSSKKDSAMRPQRCQEKLGWVDNPQCEYTARVNINGKVYCFLHASLVVARKEEFADHRNRRPIGNRCECTNATKSWWNKSEYHTREDEGWRCKRRPTIRIDGIDMCLQHARLILLQHWVKDGLAHLLPYNGPYNPLCIISQDKKG